MDRPGTSGMTQRAVLDPFACPSPSNRRRSHRGMSSPSHRRPARCLPRSSGRSPLASTGNLLLALDSKATFQPAFEDKQGISERERQKRLNLLVKEPASVTKWQRNGRFGWSDVGAEVSEQLEYAFAKGLPKFGVWDNGRFRDFDINNMKELPGLKDLRRVRQEAEKSDAARFLGRPNSSL